MIIYEICTLNRSLNTGFRALLGMVPCRTAYKTSAPAVAATTLVVSFKAAVSIEASIRWLADGHEVVVVVALHDEILLPSFQAAKQPNYQDAKMTSCKTANMRLCLKAKLQSYQDIKSAKLPSCQAAELPS